MVLVDILVSLLSSLTGISASILSSLFIKGNLLKKDEESSKKLTSKINELTKSLSKSAQLMSEVEAEFEKQKELAEKWKSEAETSKIIASMSQKEVDAVTKIFGKKIEYESKKSGRISVAWSAFFCIVGLVGGFLLSKFFL